MGHQDMQLQIGAAEFVLQIRPKLPGPCSRVDHDDPVAGPHLQAGGIPAITQMARRGGRYRSANAPELQSQSRLVPHDAPWFRPVVEKANARFDPAMTSMLRDDAIHERSDSCKGSDGGSSRRLKRPPRRPTWRALEAAGRSTVTTLAGITSFMNRIVPEH